MRRIFPLVVTVVGMAAAFVVFVPGILIAQVTNPLTGNLIETKLGLDLQGGSRVEYKVVVAPGQPLPDSGKLNTIREIMERRVNASGVGEPIVQTQGTDRIVVEMPGVSDPEAVRRLVGSTGRLDFVPLPVERYGSQLSPGPEPVPAKGQPIDPTLPVLFSGDQLSSANPVFRTDTNERAVSFTLKDKAKTDFAVWSSANVNNFFAIVLDGTVVSAPYIREPITGGDGQISGDFTAAEQKDLVTVLQFGALPYPVEEVFSGDISATLGLDFLKQSLLAGLIGIGTVFVFMLVYYRLPGLVAVIALVYYTLVVLAVFRMIPVTLTLAGVAAFVLSVGMAVDANILIFERTKEELRAGKSLYAAVEAGFNRAWNSIFDSNVSSLITATILWWFGSSVIRGFALVLIVGVLTSMFTAVSLSRTVLRFVVRRSWAQRHRYFGVGPDEFIAMPAATGRGGQARSRV